MISSYTVALPGRILFGASFSEKLNEEIPARFRRILTVTGKHAADDPAVEKVLSPLRREQRLAQVLCGTVSAEPSPAEVDGIVRAARECHADAIAAIGGGSVIDAAKAAAVLSPLDGVCGDYFNGGRAIPGKGLYFAALPTTAGTGAEMTNNSVLTDPESRVKKSLRSTFMQADLAIVDPVLSLHCPDSVTVASGLDAFIQAAEAFTNPKLNTVSGAVALSAIVKLYHNLPFIHEHPDNLVSRADMAEGAMLAGMSFAQCGLGAIHGLAHPIGSLLNVPHGVACAVIMPYVFEWNLPSCGDSYTILAQACGIGYSAADFVKAARELTAKLNVPSDFSGYGLTEQHFDFIVKNCRSASMKSNPREMSDDDVRAMLSKLAGK